MCSFVLTCGKHCLRRFKSLIFMAGLHFLQTFPQLQAGLGGLFCTCPNKSEFDCSIFRSLLHLSFIAPFFPHRFIFRSCLFYFLLIFLLHFPLSLAPFSARFLSRILLNSLNKPPKFKNNYSSIWSV